MNKSGKIDITNQSWIVLGNEKSKTIKISAYKFSLGK